MGARDPPPRFRLGPFPVPTITLNNGVKFPALGLGTYMAPTDYVGQFMVDAVRVGYRLIDCATYYDNEKEVGEGLKEAIQKGTVKREDLFVMSKLYCNCHRPDLVEAACRKSVTDLGLDYIDLYLMHLPRALRPDDDEHSKGPDGKFPLNDVAIVETYRAMEKCVESGLTKSIGVSNFNARQLSRVLLAARIKPVVNQVECHPYLQQRKLVEFCSEHDIVVMAFCPLGSPGRIRVPFSGRKNLFHEKALASLARKHDKTLPQIILRYHIQRGIIPIPKTMTRYRLVENITVFDFELDDEDMTNLNKLDCNDRVICFELVKTVHPFSIAF